MPFALVLVELIFFHNKNTIILHSKIMRISVELGILIVLMYILFYWKGDLSFFTKGYENRPFTLIERLMTQPRVLLLYLSQIFYPIPQRLSMAHDIKISHTLIDPWTTIPSILVIFGILFFGVAQIKKRPFLSFAILFFFINHSIESTILPLELVFEHRNYLPSLFLFLPLSIGFFHLMNNSLKKSILRKSLPIIGSLFLISLGFGTYVRNFAWKDEMTLWQDIDLAWGKNANLINKKRALYFFEKSLNFHKPSKFLEAGILGNMAMIYSQIGESEKAISFYKKAISADPFLKKIRYDAASLFILEERWNEALKQIDFLLETGENRADWLNLKGFVLLWQKKPNEAIPFLRKALQLEREKPAIWLNMGVALTQIGSFKNGHWFLRKAIHLAPKDTHAYFSIIENRINAGDFKNASKYANNLLSFQSISSINDFLSNYYKRPRVAMWAPLSADLVVSLLKETINKFTLKIE